MRHSLTVQLVLEISTLQPFSHADPRNLRISPGNAFTYYDRALLPSITEQAS